MVIRGVGYEGVCLYGRDMEGRVRFMMEEWWDWRRVGM